MNTAGSQSEEMRDLYRELVLDHARNPRHFGKLPAATHHAEGINPLCGDKLHLYLELADGVVDDVTFEGSGCAISVASASLLTEAVRGMSEVEARTFAAALTDRLTGASPASEVELGKLQALEGVREYPSRVKCATLAWHAMTSALDQSAETTSTE